MFSYALPLHLTQLLANLFLHTGLPRMPIISPDTPIVSMDVSRQSAIFKLQPASLLRRFVYICLNTSIMTARVIFFHSVWRSQVCLISFLESWRYHFRHLFLTLQLDSNMLGTVKLHPFDYMTCSLNWIISGTFELTITTFLKQNKKEFRDNVSISETENCLNRRSCNLIEFQPGIKIYRNVKLRFIDLE